MFDIDLIKKFETRCKVSHPFARKVHLNIVDNLRDITGVKLDKKMLISSKADLVIDDFKQLGSDFYIMDSLDSIYSGKIELDSKFNLIISPFNMHRINNIKGYLSSIFSALDQGGIFMGTMFGDGNLTELSQSFYEAYSALNIGFVNHFLPVVEIKSVGNLMQSCGFKNVVVNVEECKFKHANILDVLRDIQNVGEGNCMKNRIRLPISRAVLSKADEYFMTKHEGSSTVSIVYIFAMKK